MPNSLLEINGSVVLLGQYVHPELAAIEWYAPDGTHQKTVSLDYPYRYQPGDVGALTWEMALPITLENQLVLGFKFDNKLVMAGTDLELLDFIDMEKHYPRFVGATIVPSGYAATDLAAGPNGTILIAAPCNNEERRCPTVLQFDPQKKQVIKRWTFDFHIRTMAYRNHRLVLSSPDYDLRIFDGFLLGD